MKASEVLYETWVSLQAGRQHNPNIDEVALLFHSSVALDAFVERLPTTAEVFNSVPCDIVKRQDMLGSFQVRFEFIRLKDSSPLKFALDDGVPWRIEAMCILEGDAPLHRQKIATSVDLPTVMHWSYKCPNLDAYQGAVRAERALRSMRAEYSNSYGMFSYFGVNGLPYMKPRVNLRDL